MSTKYDEIRVCKCAVCGKDYEVKIVDNNKICDTLLKQITLNMCDKCFTDYLLKVEDAK